jgi:hypothetical protein
VRPCTKRNANISSAPLGTAEPCLKPEPHENGTTLGPCGLRGISLLRSILGTIPFYRQCAMEEPAVQFIRSITGVAPPAATLLFRDGDPNTLLKVFSFSRIISYIGLVLTYRITSTGAWQCSVLGSNAKQTLPQVRCTMHLEHTPLRHNRLPTTYETLETTCVHGQDRC